MSLHTIEKLHDLKGKTVLIRIDADVDIKNEKILDDTRLWSSIDSLKYILAHGGKAVLLGHLGRPNGKENPEFTLKPIAKWFAREFDGKVEKIILNDFDAWEIAPELFLLENLRFHKGEEKNDSTFAKKLGELGDIYVNEAFASSHRGHASIEALPKYLPSYAGLHLNREVETLTKIMDHPDRPLVVLIGGAKIETKLPMVERMHRVADYVLVGGEIAEQNKVLLKVQHQKITGQKSVVLVADNKPEGFDITDKDAENFIQILSLARTIVWNGPVGKMGNAETEKNTLKIARAIVDSGAYTVVGGGDSLTLLKQNNLLSKFSFVSTGGGAMLEFLSGKKLPGISTLET